MVLMQQMSTIGNALQWERSIAYQWEMMARKDVAIDGVEEGQVGA